MGYIKGWDNCRYLKGWDNCGYISRDGITVDISRDVITVDISRDWITVDISSILGTFGMVVGLVVANLDNIMECYPPYVIGSPGVLASPPSRNKGFAVYTV